MARRKQPHIPDQLLDQLLAGTDAKAAFAKDGLLDELKKALAERVLNAEIDLGLQQGTEHLIERVLAPEAVGNDLVEGGAHPGELQRRHQLQQLMPLHATLPRPAPVAARRNGRSRRPARRSAVMLPGWRSAPAAVASAVVPGC